ncbi:MFS transporter [Corynebacterium deserti]|uniref:MFS transporter n=1 Tax=Corynebacterium deserti TaxID=1408191 RepID=UPI000A8A608D|nr:MFS transporter [Corynebacterium deserti]
MLVDRFGPRKLLFAGALIMAVGQLILGFTDSYALAIFARVLIGVGDSSAFLSVMRLLPSWFPLKWASILQQLTGALGFIGQFVSAVPFLHMLNTIGWTVSFASLGASGIIVACAAAVVVRDEPASTAQVWPAQPEASTSKQPCFAANLKYVVTSLYCWQDLLITG